MPRIEPVFYTVCEEGRGNREGRPRKGQGREKKKTHTRTRAHAHMHAHLRHMYTAAD